MIIVIIIEVKGLVYGVDAPFIYQVKRKSPVIYYLQKDIKHVSFLMFG